jgi:YHS domain-containing protein
MVDNGYSVLQEVTMAIDLVCKMKVDEATAQWTSEYKGQKYYFCGPGCKQSFDKNPEQYLAEGGEAGDAGHHHAG